MNAKNKLFFMLLLFFSVWLGGTVTYKAYQKKNKDTKEFIWAAKMKPIMQEAVEKGYANGNN